MERVWYKVAGTKAGDCMKIAVCDDNKAFCEAFANKLEAQFEAKGWDFDYAEFSSGGALLAADLTDVQAVFLDIDMPGVNGVETARLLRERSEDMIIVFVTAFPEYALKGYWVGALLYLLKESVDEQLPACVDAVIEKLSDGRKYVKVQTTDAFLNLRVKDILYFEGTATKRVVLHTLAAEPVTCIGRLGEYGARLTEYDFLRIQQSYLVNMQHILDIRNYAAKLTNGEILRVSRKDYSEITRRYVTWKARQL